MNSAICETCINFDEYKKTCDTGRINPDNMYDCGGYYKVRPGKHTVKDRGMKGRRACSPARKN